MFVSDQLRQFFVRKSERQPEPPLPRSISIELPDEDDAEAFNPSPDSTHDHDESRHLLGYAEGQSFVIEYIDGKQNKSIRRITVWGIKLGAHDCPVLVAKCHERNAQRSFRLDRITAVFDYDGVVQEPLEDFFVETFGMARRVIDEALKQSTFSHGTSPEITPTKLETNERWNAIKAICRGRGVPLLCLIARADSYFHLAELQIIENYAKQCCGSESIDLSLSEEERLSRYIRGLRPSANTVERCLDHAANWNNHDIRELLETCAHVVKADGHVEAAELEDLNVIVESLTGQRLF